MGCKASKTRDSVENSGGNAGEQRDPQPQQQPQQQQQQQQQQQPAKRFRHASSAFTSPSFYDSVVRETMEVDAREDHRGNPLINNYQILRRLGKGRFGEVSLVVDTTTDELLAMKTLAGNSVRKTVSTLKRLGSVPTLASSSQCDGELEILKQVRHPNIATLYEVIYDTKNHCVYLILEYMRGGELCKLNRDGTVVGGPRSVEQIREQAGGILAALSYLHANKFAHRDLFPPNILMDEYKSPKLIDFSTTITGEKLDDEIDTSHLGNCTLAFLAPEFMEFGYGVTVRRAMQGDMWSLGVLIYALATGVLPFTGNDDNIRKHLLSRAVVSLPPQLKDPSLRSLILHLLEYDPKERFTAQLAQEHTFFRSCTPTEYDDLEVSQVPDHH